MALGTSFFRAMARKIRAAARKNGSRAIGPGTSFFRAMARIFRAVARKKLVPDWPRGQFLLVPGSAQD